MSGPCIMSLPAHIAAAIAHALSDCMHCCMASMSMVISPMSIDFIMAIVSIATPVFSV